jgi:hypothetical protein
VREYFGKFGCDSTIFVSYGGRKKEEGRRKINWFPGSGWEPRARGSASRAKKNRRQSKSEMPSQPEPGNEEKTTFYKICLLPKQIIHQRQKRP